MPGVDKDISQCCMECERIAGELAKLKEENERIMRCYESATGKAVCGEGSVCRVECQQMTLLRKRLAEAEGLLRKLVENPFYGHGWFERVKMVADYFTSPNSDPNKHHRIFCKVCEDETGQCLCDAPTVVQPTSTPKPFKPGDVLNRVYEKRSAPVPGCTCKTVSHPACPVHGLWPEKEPDMVMVKREDLQTLWEYIPDCYRWPKGGKVIGGIVWIDRLKAALAPKATEEGVPE